jgi:hypothetical protein
MENCALRILSGMHAGAVIHLVTDQIWSIGNDVSANVCLLDENIQTLHARLTWVPEEGNWRLLAEAGDISVFGYPLKPGAEAELMAGSHFSLGSVSCDIATMAAPDAAGQIKVMVADAAMENLARMRFIRKAHRFHYGLALTRSYLREKYVMPVLWAGTASVAVIAMLLSKPDLSTEYREDAVREIHRIYPNVEQHLNPVTGFTTYTGYVQDQQQLGALRQMALKANYGAVIMNVLPMDVLASNVTSMLDEHYRDAQVNVIGPGEITADIASVDAIKDLDGWNFDQVQAGVLHELPELKTLSLNLKQPSPNKVDVPLDRLGFSVVSSSADQPIVVSQRGDILFTGAQVKEGHLDGISLCSVQLLSSTEAEIFNMTASKEKKDECK